MRRKVLIVNLGCPKNLVDSEALAFQLSQVGYDMTGNLEKAHEIIINTCGFIQDAVEESIDTILEIADSKNDDQRISVVGCLVGRYKEELVENLPEVALFVPPEQMDNLPNLLINSVNGYVPVNTGKPSVLLGSYENRVPTTGPGWAYVKLAEGCDNNCHYCIIPQIKGPLVSRSIDSILREIDKLAGLGIAEVNLVAQDLTDYGKDNSNNKGLEKLVTQISAISGIKWIRMHYLNPESVTESIINLPNTSSKILPYYDIPIQHVAKSVVKKMGRKKSHADIAALIDLIRRTSPKAVIRGTVMVGHPGEGDQEFQELMEFIRLYQLDHLGCFRYQAEEGTISAKMERCSEEVARERLDILMREQKDISKAKLAAKVGQSFDTLVLGPHQESELVWKGRCWFQAPDVDGEVIITDGNATPGSIVTCKIVDSFEYDLEAHIQN